MGLRGHPGGARVFPTPILGAATMLDEARRLRGPYASILLKSGGSYAAPGTPPRASMRTPSGPE